MGLSRWSDAGYDMSLRLIGKRLRDKGENVTQEPLPERWVDLIRYLDEQERKRSQGLQPPASSGAAESDSHEADSDSR